MKLLPLMSTGIPAVPLVHRWAVGRTAASAQRDGEGSEGVPALFPSRSQGAHVPLTRRSLRGL